MVQEIFGRVLCRRRNYRPIFHLGAAAIVIVLTLPLNARLIYGAFKPEAEWSPMLGRIYARVEAFRIVNGYGLFRVMTKDRREIVIEGSADGIDWKPYEFKWKPGDVMRAPGWCQPHQPRLDWQMWFAALGSHRQNPWFARPFIGIDSPTPKNIDKPARGGNAPSSANICRAFHSKPSDNIRKVAAIA